MTARPRFADAVAALARLHGTRAPAAFADPWRAVLWENVAYLVDDDRRAAAFARLEREVGVDAAAILAAPDGALRAICAAGILAEGQARKLRRCAELLTGLCAGDPARLGDGTAAEARRRLKRFPGIGEPGADRILLFARGRATPALESNGLRVLQRLGFAPAKGGYATVYRAACRAVAAEGPHPRARLESAWSALRRHGQEVCRRSAPACGACPLREDCRFAAAASAVAVTPGPSPTPPARRRRARR